MAVKARVRNLWGTILFVLVGLGSLTFALSYNVWDLVLREHKDTMPVTDPIVRASFLCIFASSGIITLMLASFRVLTDVYKVMGSFMLLLGAAAGSLLVLLDPLDYYRSAFCIITVLTGLMLCVPRQWSVSKFILPYHVVKLETSSV